MITYNNDSILMDIGPGLGAFYNIHRRWCVSTDYIHYRLKAAPTELTIWKD